MKKRVFDAHLHFFNNNEFADKLASNIGDKADKNYYINKYIKDGTIAGGIVMGNGPLEVQGQDLPDNFYYCVGLDQTEYVDNLEAHLDEIKRHLNSKKCVGIKIYPGYVPYYPSDEIYAPIYELLCKYNKVLSVHTGMVSEIGYQLKYVNPLDLDEVAVKYPNLKIVMCHFGNPFLDEAAAVMEHCKNIYADLSGLIEGQFSTRGFVRYEKEYVTLIKTWIKYIGGSTRFMYGSDWPAVNENEYIKFISKLFSKKQYENIFYNNAIKIYGIEE